MPPESGPILRSLRQAGASLRRVSLPGAAAIVLLWLALIWLLSSIGGDDDSVLADVPSLWLNTAHAGEFGLLALWLTLLLPRTETWIRTTQRDIALVLVATLAFALLDEWHQSWVPGRHPTFLDVLTDVTGAACVLWLVSYVGTSRVTESGVLRRLLLSLLACIGCAWAGTAYHTIHPEPLWFGAPETLSENTTGAHP